MLMNLAVLFELRYQLILDLKAALEHPSTHRADFPRYPSIYRTSAKRKKTEHSTLQCKGIMRIPNQVYIKRLGGENITLAKMTRCWLLKLFI